MIKASPKGLAFYLYILLDQNKITTNIYYINITINPR